MKRGANNRLKVVAVRVDPQIERRLRLLAEATGRKQSFFLQQIIEQGIDAIETMWLPPATLAKVRRGDFPKQQRTSSTPDFFGE